MTSVGKGGGKVLKFVACLHILLFLKADLLFIFAGFIRRPPVQHDHFWMVPRVVVFYRFDCIFSK